MIFNSANIKTSLIALSLLGAVSQAVAKTKVAPQDDSEIKLSFAPIVRRAGPAVVNIYARKIVEQRRGWMFNDPFFRRFFGEDFPFGGSNRNRVENSLGSGVIVASRGIIVTNNHVIKDADDIKVVLADRREFDATLLLKDKRTDIAVLRIEAGDEKLPKVILADSDGLEVGDLVLALGNPFGVGRTVTSGIVSALARTSVGITDYRFFIQTDAAINPGNSGGALVDMTGRLVGINTAIYSRNGGSLGIGFAVPSNMVRAILESAMSGKPLVRPWVSFTGKNVTSDIANAIGLGRPFGVLVEKVHEGGPAADAGLRRGDVILRLDRHEIEDGQALRFRLATRQLGDIVELMIFRQGKRLQKQLELLPPPDIPDRNITELEGQHPLLGAKIANLNPALAAELGIDTEANGVMILAIQRNSPAARYGFKPGDIVLEVNGREISRVRDLKRLVQEPYEGWRLKLRRDGRRLNVRIG
ncbi:MAG: DegQ family serine endoprotease [Pseudomonadota bacterium]|nr:DegQ family serine endoprotease [Pseudomonadota bacterium]